MQRYHKGNVLIVDNDDRILWAFREHLENAGFDTEATWSGHEALVSLGSGKFDILLVDDYLPTFTLTIFSRGSAAYRTNLRSW